MANIHYKVLSFFIAGRAALQESLAFAAGASLFSLIFPAALSAAKGRYVDVEAAQLVLRAPGYCNA